MQVAEALRSTPAIRKVQLNTNEIGTSGALAVARSLQGMKQLQVCQVRLQGAVYGCLVCPKDFLRCLSPSEAGRISFGFVSIDGSMSGPGTWCASTHVAADCPYRTIGDGSVSINPYRRG